MSVIKGITTLSLDTGAFLEIAPANASVGNPLILIMIGTGITAPSALTVPTGWKIDKFFLDDVLSNNYFFAVASGFHDGSEDYYFELDVAGSKAAALLTTTEAGTIEQLSELYDPNSDGVESSFDTAGAIVAGNLGFLGIWWIHDSFGIGAAGDDWALTQLEPTDPDMTLRAVSRSGNETLVIGEVVSKGTFDGYNAEVTGVATSDFAYGYIFQFIPAVTDAKRVRSSHSKGVGSLLESVQVEPIKSSYSEAFFIGDSPPVGNLYQFEQYLKPGIPSALYYPRPTNNFEHLDTQRGKDKLDRMEETYPPPIMTLASSLGFGSQMTGQEALEYIFSVWSTTYFWFTYKPVPDLRVRALTPDRADDFALTTRALFIPQPLENRKTMRQIMDEILEIFSPCIPFQDTDGDLRIICLNGPDAPNSSFPLTWADIEKNGWSKSEPNEDTVFNGATVISQGYESLAFQEPLQPGWIALRHSNYFPSDTDEWFDPPPDRVPLSPAPTDGSSPGEGYTQQDGFIWPLGDEIIPFSNMIFTEELNPSVSLITGNYRHVRKSNDPSFPNPKSGALDITILRDLPLDGNEYIVATASASSAVNENLSAQLQMRYDESLRAVIVDIINVDIVRQFYSEPTFPPFFGDFYAMFEFNLTALSSVWARSPSRITAQFTRLSGAFIPTEDDQTINLIETSFNQYGDREKTLYSNFFQLTTIQAYEIAQGFVLANIEAKVRREIKQSVRNKYPIGFDDIGSYAATPDGQLLLIENVAYSDDFSSTSWSMDSTVSGTVATPPFIAKLPCYLTDHTGAILLDHAGEPLTTNCTDGITAPGGTTGAAPVSLSLRGDPTFSNTTKGGGAMSAGQIQAYDAVKLFFDNNQEFGGSSTIPLIGSSGYFTGKNYGSGIEADGYQISRFGQQYILALFHLLRITGDLTCLDKATELMAAYYPSWKTGWTSPKTSDPTTGASPYKAVRSFAGQPTNLYGKDLTALEENRNYALVAQVAYALELNRDLTSPGGNNYGAEADKWKDILFNHFVPKWRGGGDSGWRAGYKGFEQRSQAGTIRAADGAIPFIQRLEFHTLQCKLKGDYYMHLLTGDSAWLTSFNDDMLDMVNDEYLRITTAYGDGRIWRHSPVSFNNNPPNYSQEFVYFGFTMNDCVDLYLEGAFGGIDEDFLKECARTMADFWIPTATTAKKDLGGGVSRTTQDSTVIPSNTTNADPTPFATTYYPQGVMIGFDTVDDHLETELTTNFNSAGGGFAAPKAPHIPVGLFLKRTDLTTLKEFWNVPQGSSVTDPTYYDLDTQTTYAKSITLNAGTVADPLNDPECPSDLTAGYATRTEVTPASDIAAVLAAASANDVIWFTAGTYTSVNLTNVTKDIIFAGAQGAILDGGGAVGTAPNASDSRAIYSEVGPNVRVYNLEIRNYPAKYDGSQDPFGPHLKVGTGYLWRCYVHDNANIGIDMGTECVGRFLVSENNGRMNYYFNNGSVVNDSSGFRLEYSVSRNANTAAFDANDASGCFKVFEANGGSWRWLLSENENGHGPWWDAQNKNILVEYCVSKNNDKAGFHYEISHTATIRNCTAEDNNDHGFFISNADDVILDGVYSRRNRNGIWLKDYSRGNDPVLGTPYRTENIVVKNSYIFQTKDTTNYNYGKASGFDSKLTNDLAAQNIVFQNNQYFYDDLAGGANIATDTPFLLHNAPSPDEATFTQWKAAAGEAGSTLKYQDLS